MSWNIKKLNAASDCHGQLAVAEGECEERLLNKQEKFLDALRKEHGDDKIEWESKYPDNDECSECDDDKKKSKCKCSKEIHWRILD